MPPPRGSRRCRRRVRSHAGRLGRGRAARRRPAPRWRRPRPGRCRGPGRRPRSHLGRADDDDVVEAPGRRAGRRCGPCSGGATRNPDSVASRTAVETSAAVREGPRRPGAGRPRSSRRRGRRRTRVAGQVDPAVEEAREGVGGRDARGVELDGHGVTPCRCFRCFGGTTVPRARSPRSPTSNRGSEAAFAPRAAPGLPTLSPWRSRCSARSRSALDGSPVDLGTPKQRALVAALALSRGRRCRSTRSSTCVGRGRAARGDRDPPGLRLPKLRRVLEPDRRRRAPATVLVTVAPGYALRVPDRASTRTRSKQGRLAPTGGCSRWAGGLAARRRALAAQVAALDEDARAVAGHPVRRAGDADAAWPSALGWRSCGWSPWRTGRSPTWPWGTTRRWRPTSRRSDRPPAGAVLGAPGARPDPVRAAGGRARRARQVREVLDEGARAGAVGGAAGLQTAVLRQDPELGGWPRRPAPSRRRPAASRRSRRPPRPPRARSRSPRGRWSDGMPTSSRSSTSWEAAERRIPSYASSPATRASASRAWSPARRAGPAAGMLGAGRSLLAGRRGSAAVAVEDRAGRVDGLGATLLDEVGTDDLAARGAGRPVPNLESIAGAVRRRPRPAHHGRARRPPLERTPRRSASCGCSPRRPTGPVAGRGHLAPLAPGADRTLADVAAALAQMHALRLQLSRPAGGQERRPCSRVSLSRELGPQEAAAPRAHRRQPVLPGRARTPGGEGRGRRAPDRRHRVINRRLLRLPEQTVTAPAHRGCDRPAVRHPTLATVTGIDEDDLLDVVEPAQAAAWCAGRDRPVPVRPCAGARHAARAQMSASRRARAHARVAEALTGIAGRETEVAPALAAGRAVVRRPGLAVRRRGGDARPAALRLRPGRRAAPSRRWSRSTATPRPRCATGTTCSWR